MGGYDAKNAETFWLIAVVVFIGLSMYCVGSAVGYAGRCLRWAFRLATGNRAEGGRDSGRASSIAMMEADYVGMA